MERQWFVAARADSRFLTGPSARFGMTNSCLGELEAVGLAEQVPGLAVGVVDVGFAAAFGA